MEEPEDLDAFLTNLSIVCAKEEVAYLALISSNLVCSCRSSRDGDLDFDLRVALGEFTDPVTSAVACGILYEVLRDGCN